MLLDITNDEPIVDAPVARAISHSYPDALPDEARVRCYSLEELIAEKTRALVERSRPRDLYDVVYLLDNLTSGVDLAHTRALFTQKCGHKGIATPSPEAIFTQVASSAELRADWDTMLAHQLPVLPSFDSVLARLPECVAWIAPGGALAAAALPMLPLHTGEIVVPALQFRRATTVRAATLDVVAFAGTNRLLLRFDYPDSQRRGMLRERLVEPYSLRRPRTGNLLLYAWNTESDSIRAYKVDSIRNASVTATPYHPRYRIEFVSPRQRLNA